MIEAVILAGGLGTRLKSVSGNIPKPMVKVGSKPFLYHVMEKLEFDGVDKIILSLFYEAQYIIERINIDKPVSIPIEFVVDKDRLGTGGAIKHAAKVVESNKFIVVNGDTFLNIDFLKFYFNSDVDELSISAVSVPDVSRYGVLHIDNTDKVISMEEKSGSGPGYINGGAYIICKDSILNYPNEVFSFERDYIKNFDKPFKAYKTSGYFIDIGIPEDYTRACEVFE